MISWMQKHKKWLVITIWISTIAFVGAGFVGWGSYDYGSKAGTVAVVGEREISVDEYQREYSALYQQYSQIFGEQFNQEMAKSLKLSDAAVKLAIQKNLILSYGDSLGLAVTDEEVAKELVQMNAFVIGGKFDKQTYIKVLAQNGTTPLAFEESLKRNLLLQKVEKLFKLQPVSQEVENISALMFLEDKINILVIDSKDSKINESDAAIKAYWETNKNKYMSSVSYDLEIDTVDISNNSYTDIELKDRYNKNKNSYKKDDGKLKSFDEAKNDIKKELNIKDSKKIALKKYLKLKKAEEKFTSKVTMFEDKLSYGPLNLAKIQQASEGLVLKPFLDGNKFITVKVNKKIAPKALSYDIAKYMAKDDYSKTQKMQVARENALKLLPTFKGKSLGFISRTDAKKITDLNEAQASEFLQKLFAAKDVKGRIEVGDKIVLFSISDSRLVKVDKEKIAGVKQALITLQDNELMTNLVKQLETKYDIKSSIETKE